MQRAFSLLELLVVLALLALLAGIGLPGVHRWLAENRAERTTHQITAALMYARTEAVFRRAPVLVCPVGSDDRCNGDWSGRVLVFHDSNRDTRWDEAEPLLRVFEPVPEKVTLRAFRTRRYFRYRTNGQTDWQNGRFTICSTVPGVSPRAIVVNVQGRARIDRRADQAVCENST